MSSFQDETTTTSPSSSWDEEEHIEEDDESIDSDQDDASLRQEYDAWVRALDKAISGLEKKRNSLQSELNKAQSIEATSARAQLLVSNLYLFQDGAKSAMVTDWETGEEVLLELSSEFDSASSEADALFAQVRKLKRGSKVVSDLLEETADAWEILQAAKVDLTASVCDNDDGTTTIDQGRFGLVQDRLSRTSRVTKFQIPQSQEDSSSKKSSGNNSRKRKPEIGTPASNIRKLTSPGGCTVLVGRNKRGNEYLSMNIARGSDVWMHSRGCPGAHVVVFHRRGGPVPTDACLQFAADVAIFYSDLRNESKAPVSLAEPKHLQKPRNAPLGAIKVREEKGTLFGRPDRVPDYLKDAREASGQSDEYRNLDKAKHRQRTKRASKEAAAKKKKAIKAKRKQKTEQENDFY